MEVRNLPPTRITPSRVLRGQRWLFVDVPEWLPTSEGAGLRLMRVAKGVMLSHAAETAGVTVYLWSRLERGRAELVDQADWELLRAAVITAEREMREGAEA